MHFKMSLINICWYCIHPLQILNNRTNRWNYLGGLLWIYLFYWKIVNSIESTVDSIKNLRTRRLDIITLPLRKAKWENVSAPVPWNKLHRQRIPRAEIYVWLRRLRVKWLERLCDSVNCISVFFLSPPHEIALFLRSWVARVCSFFLQ